MNLNEQALNNLLDIFKDDVGTKVYNFRLTDKTLDEMLSLGKHKPFLEEKVLFYDDEENPNLNNWIDVEGQGYGWLFMNREEDEWHSMIVESMTRTIKSYIERLHSEDFHVVRLENKDGMIAYRIIDREVGLSDTQYVFSDELLSIFGGF